MNYRLAFVFPYEGFENTLICIISFGPSTDIKLSYFSQKRSFAGTFKYCFFEIVYQKGFFW